jgi:hypothetical protein
MSKQKDRLDFYVQTNLGRLVQVVVIDKSARVKDVLLPGERVGFGALHDEYIHRVKARDQKKT